MRNLTILKVLSLTCAAIVTLMGATFIISWHLGLFTILQFPPSNWPLPYTTSVAILLIGLAIFSIFFFKEAPIANILGLFVSIFAFLRILEISFHFESVLNDLTLKFLPLPPIIPQQMILIGAISYLLVGIVLVTWTKTKQSFLYNNLLIFISLVVVFLALLGILATLLPIKSTLGWQDTVPIHFYSSVAVMLSGIALILARTYYEIISGVSLIRSFPFIVTLTFLVLTVLLALGIKSQRDGVLEEIVKSKADTFLSQINSHLQNELRVFSRMVNRVEFSKSFPEENWEVDANILIRDEFDLQSIAWTDSDLGVKNIIPSILKSQSVSTPIFKLKKQQQAEFDLAKKERKKFAFLSANPSTLHVSYPAVWDSKTQGFFVFSIDIVNMFQAALKDPTTNDYAIEVFYENQKIFALNKPNLIDIKSWKIKRPIAIANVNLSMRVTPTFNLIANHLSNEVIYMTLVGGFLISVGLGMLIHLWQLAQSRISTVEDSQNQLEKIKDDLLYTLNVAAIGSWSWDLTTNKIVANEVTNNIFGLKPNSFDNYDLFLNMLHPEDRETLEINIKNSIDNNLHLTETYRIFWPDGSTHYVTTRGRTYFDDQGKPKSMVGICWDITEIKRSQLYLKTSERITKSISEAMTVAEAAMKIRHILQRIFGWEVMIIWMRDQKSDFLNCLEISVFHELHIPEFEKYTRTTPLSKHETAPGEVLSTHRPIWFREYAKTVLSSRAKEVEKAGLKGSFAFPIFAGSSLVGIVELFKTTPFAEEVDEAILNLCTSIGIYLGQFIQRQTSEDAQTQLASIVKHASGGIYICDLNGIIKTWNAGAEKIYGWSEKEIVGQTVTILYPPEKVEEYSLLQKKIISGEGTQKFEAQHVRKDGKTIWVGNSYSPIRNDAGEIISISIIAQEITQQKMTTLELQRSEEKFRAFIETTEEWIWEIDSNFRVTYSNPSVQKILGFSPQEVIGKELFIFIPEKNRDTVKSEIQGFIKEKRGWTERLYKARHINGTFRYLESNSVPIFDEKNKITGFRGADRDVTERRIIEKSKNEFISVISHELRTPLTSIHGAIGLITAIKDLPEKARELASVAYRNSERLSHIINDILDIEKNKLGKFEFKPKAIVVADIVREAVVSFKPVAEKSRITLIEEKLLPDVKVYADPERLIQVMANLLSNAIKFSHPMGSVYISMEKFENTIRVLIRDEGIGISKEFEPRVFERFAQANSSDSRHTGGTGLGLNVCKNIIDLIGGQIAFTSVKGQGTTFYFDLPILPKS